MNYRIGVELSPNGFTVLINNQFHPVVYPQYIWSSFSPALRQSFAETIAFITTIHKSYPRTASITYLFPAPILESLIYFGLCMTAAENVADIETKQLRTSDLLKIIMGSYYKKSFLGPTRPQAADSSTYTPKKNTALLPFSFGKDSLLTFALCRDLGLTPIPIFLLEPSNIQENKHKLLLKQKFEREFSVPIHTFSVPLTQLRQSRGLSWGWDLLLTQYTLFLIPFLHYFRPNYFFWSNDYNCSTTITDPEGFRMSFTFDQTGHWMQTLNTAFSLFGISAQLGSLVEPLTELTNTYLLHGYYPGLAKYHTTCQNESPTKRWCGHCYDCARFFIFLKAFGFDPKTINLTTNMLTKRKFKKFRLFKTKQQPLDYWRDQFSFYRDEALYAFYLAYKRGVTGFAIDVFKKDYLASIQKQKRALFKTYLTPHTDLTVPQDLKPKLQKIIIPLLAMLRGLD